MPTLITLDSIKIMIYFQDHAPPHFHAFYNEYEVLIVIATLEVYRGELPNKQQKRVIEWASNNQAILQAKWDEFNPGK